MMNNVYLFVGKEDVEKSNEQIFKSTKKLSAVKKDSTSSMKSNNESSRKKSQTKKKSSVDNKVDRKTSNPRKSSQKSGDNNVIKTSLTVRLKSKNTEEAEKKVVPNGKYYCKSAYMYMYIYVYCIFSF